MNITTKKLTILILASLCTLVIGSCGNNSEKQSKTPVKAEEKSDSKVSFEGGTYTFAMKDAGVGFNYTIELKTGTKADKWSDIKGTLTIAEEMSNGTKTGIGRGSYTYYDEDFVWVAMSSYDQTFFHKPYQLFIDLTGGYIYLTKEALDAKDSALRYELRKKK
jgi:hypothetical protein